MRGKEWKGALQFMLISHFAAFHGGADLVSLSLK